MTNYTETEVKFYYPDLSAIASELIRAGAKVTTPRLYERNVRYEDSGETLTHNGVVVRLRQDYRARLTYKGPGKIVNGLKQRYEVEVEVSDFEAMSVILENLGYHPHMTYEKYRTTYELDGTEIVLDEMPYGNFVEIEGDAHVIPQIITKLGLTGRTRYDQSYTGLFEIIKRNLDLDFPNLTFEDFDGIDVPESALMSSDEA